MCFHALIDTFETVIEMIVHVHRVEGGYLWESGQKGPLLQRNKDQSPVSNIKAATAVANSNGGQKLRNKEKIRVRDTHR